MVNNILIDQTAAQDDESPLERSKDDGLEEKKRTPYEALDQ